jgi:hypothetical protein
MEADMTSTQEPNGDLPVWVRVLFRYGIVGFLCLVFAWVLLKDVRESQAAIRADIAAHFKQSEQFDAALRYYLWRVCLNTAPTEPERAGCVLPSESR